MKIYYIIGSTITTKTSGTGVIHCFEFDVHFTFYKKKKKSIREKSVHDGHSELSVSNS